MRGSRFAIPGILLLCVLACATQKISPPKLPDNQGFKTLRFADFVGKVNERARQLPLEVAIPTHYERAELPDVPEDYSYWMPRDRVKAVSQSGDLPADTGYFYSKVSLDVGYDADEKLFVGFEDQDPAAKMKEAGIADFTWERAEVHGYPAIFCRFRNPNTKQIQYNSYIAPLYEGLVFFVSYTPPSGDPAGGEKIWSRFRSALAGERRNPAAP
jgi:hypothetical protein